MTVQRVQGKTPHEIIEGLKVDIAALSTEIERQRIINKAIAHDVMKGSKEGIRANHKGFERRIEVL